LRSREKEKITVRQLLAHQAGLFALTGDPRDVALREALYSALQTT
jgi:CubicO group peptidase (beta-lactamase class C family)